MDFFIRLLMCTWHFVKGIEETIYHSIKILQEKILAKDLKFRTSTGSNLVNRKPALRVLSTLNK